jgi:arylsulfatase
VSFDIDGVGLGQGGAAQLWVDGRLVGQQRIERTIAFKFTPEGAAVGHDTGTPLVDDYTIPGTYQGTISSVIVDLQPVQTPYSSTMKAGR